MAYTSHGHQIIGTVVEPRPKGMKIARCGGADLCGSCALEAAAAKFKHPMTEHPSMPPQRNLSADNFQSTAKGIVRNYINRMGLDDEEPFLIHVVWFSKTLQNWKALLTTTLSDHRYYEVTHNGDKGESYLDVYLKENNVLIGPNGGAKHGGE